MTTEKLEVAAEKLYQDLVALLGERDDISWADGEARVDDAFDALDEVFARLKGLT